MITASLSTGVSYSIPPSDTEFFVKLAERMKWDAVPSDKKKEKTLEKTTWVEQFAAKWQDSRSAEQIVKDIRDARTVNDEISL